MSKTNFTAAHLPAKDIHATVTNGLIAAIEASPGDWTMPWRRSGQSLRLPLNADSKRAYRGINTVVLWVTAQESGYASRYWATYKQWSELGAQVRKGEKGTPVVFYKTFHANPDPDDPNDDGARRTARSFTVFNASQVDNFDDPDAAAKETLPADASQRMETAERFIAATRADIRYGGDRAFYRPSTDHIQMPLLSSFTGTDTMPADEAFVATKLHEILHWCGAPHRLNREFGKRFGDEAYAFEELVAEIGACMLMAELSIAPNIRPDHAQYLAHWLGILKQDKRAIFTAAARAQDAVEFLRTLQTEPAQTGEEPLAVAA